MRPTGGYSLAEDKYSKDIIRAFLRIRNEPEQIKNFPIGIFKLPHILIEYIVRLAKLQTISEAYDVSGTQLNPESLTLSGPKWMKQKYKDLLELMWKKHGNSTSLFNHTISLDIFLRVQILKKFGWCHITSLIDNTAKAYDLLIPKTFRQ